MRGELALRRCDSKQYANHLLRFLCLLASPFILAACGNSGADLYADYQHANPDSAGVTQKYVDGKVLKVCSAGADQKMIFGWIKVRMVVAGGGMSSTPEDMKLYVLSERFDGSVTNVQFLGPDQAEPLIAYGASKGCALSMD
jgi:hypothetical protein